MTQYAPIAAKHNTERTFHGDTFTDPYEWLRNKENSDVIAHLETENAYTHARLAHTKKLQADLISEYREHTALDDVSVPTRLRNYWYYSAISEGDQYRKHYRVPADPADTHQAPPQIDPKAPQRMPDGTDAQLLIDENALADGHEFFRLENLEVSPNDRYITYGIDNNGDERYTQHILDTVNGKSIDHVDNVVYGVAWSASSTCIYYTRADEAWRTCEVWVHRIGQPADTDTRVYYEADPTFNLGIEGSRDGKWIIIETAATNTSEILLIDAHAMAGSYEARPTSVAGRNAGIQYSAEPAGDHLLILHNLNNVDFELAWMELPAPGVPGSPSSFRSLSTPQDGQRYNRISAYAGHAILDLRADGLESAYYLLPDPDNKWVIEGQMQLDKGAQTVWSIPSPWWWEPQARFAAQSLRVPPTVADIDPCDGHVTIRKTQETPGYNPDNYIETRTEVEAADGAMIPLTIIRHKDTPQDGTAPGLIYGYGSYEVAIDPVWSPARQSLLDRGMVWALANPRGGGEKGRRWYEDGRMLAKMNTFTDFIACSHALIERGYVAEGRLAAQGGSAGGLLMGAITNLAPDTYRAVLAQVPFVDALTTILNPDLPLTAGEWEEWGNPIESADVYQYMKAYSPYENVRDGVQYPAVFATTSLNDTRVFYVEPAKWVQRLREATASDPKEHPVLMHCEMVAGHAGVTGREARWRENARDMAFVLDQLRATELVH